jgi:hypothetical protein
MHRFALLAGSLALMAVAFLPSAPAAAANTKQKTATCKFYADQQKLAGAKRTQFMAKCMSGKNDPRGPAAGKPGTAEPAGAEPEPEGEPQQ